MASVASDAALFDGIYRGNLRGVQAALAAGANVNGFSEATRVPTVAVAAPSDAEAAELGGLLPGFNTKTMPGERPLHVAAKRGEVEIVRELLGRDGADVNAKDKRGCTPLFAACTCQQSRTAVVGSLLKAGANASLAESRGITPLHLAAQNGHIDLVHMLCDRAPATVNRYADDGQTPLFLACSEGRERVVSLLLVFGAMQELPPTESRMCPLAVAVMKGSMGVVRVLINHGMEAVGGTPMLAVAVYVSICCHQPAVLRLLLAAEGEEKLLQWANASFYTRKMLHHGVAYGSPAVVSVLLAAGANGEGRIPPGDIGVDSEFPMDRGGKVAMRRMLTQGPAYRARSWAWPAEEVDGGACRDGDVALLSQPAAPTAPVGARFFRPESDRKFFVNLVGRYCEKN